jgi:hypothetical protein
MLLTLFLFHQLKKRGKVSVHQRNNCQNQETAPEWEKIFTSYSADKGLTLSIHKEFKTLNRKRLIIQLVNRQRN